MARGKSRSNTIAGVLQQTETLSQNGVKEIVLTGVNLGDFGLNVQGERVEDFTQLVKALDQQQAVPRFRISSIEPNLLTTEIIETVAGGSCFMPHFHIPLQSGSNKTLAAMRRRYRRELYAEKVAIIKATMPHAAIGVDVIVGFPGETPEDFQETVQFIQSLDVSYLHVFTYSDRVNTHALQIQPIVPIAIRNERYKILRNLSYRLQQVFQEKFLGTERKVLWEDFNKNGMMEGYTDNYIRVKTPYREEWAHQIMDWTLN
jgi:threonylcarbamoyladenosine tRNA methylthiotransferase MtaB